MCQISINPEHVQSWDQFRHKDGKYLIKIIFDIKIEIGVFQIPNMSNFNKFWALLWTNLGQTGGHHLIKIFFDIKIGIGISEISHEPNFNKF